MEKKHEDPPMQVVLKMLCSRELLQTAPEPLPDPTALQPPGKDLILPKPSPLLGPEGLTMWQEPVAH